jgi:hypothetical protein
VEIGAEAALFPGKEYISGIFLAVKKITRAIFLTDEWAISAIILKKDDNICDFLTL